MNVELAASYAHCQRIARRSGSSFYYSFLLLPRRKRLAMCALYAYLRRTDDLADGLEPIECRRQSLARWRATLEHALAGRHEDPMLPALADVVRTFSIPLEHLWAAIDGAEMDLARATYDTFAQLETYCELVASQVGLACLRIWGCHASEAIAPARRCGIAFQMTNILRDLGEDARRGRVYLPREDFDRFGYSADELRAGVCDERFRRLMRFQVERNQRLYEEGAALEPWLDATGRRVFGSMTAVYRALLAEISRFEGAVLSRRVRLSNWRKMRIATRYLLFRRARLPAARAAAP
jgi:phytoene synthase